VTYHLILDGNDVKQVDESACASDVCSMTLDAPLATGVHKWIIRAVDVPGHALDSTSNFTFTAISAPTASFTMAPNPVLVGRDVTFDGSATADAAHTIVKYEWDLDGDGSFETDTGTSPTAKREYLTAGDVIVTLKATDSTGTPGTATNALKVTTIAGTVFLGVTINNGAQYTKSPNVTVTATFPGATTQMVFSNDGGFLKPSVFTPQKETQWKLDSSGPERLPKTIYVRFFTGPFPSETFQDDIILDETPPKVDAASVAPSSPTASGAARAAKVKRWKAKLKATDSNSGVQYVQLTSNKKKPGKLLKYKRKLTVKSAQRPKWVRARDKAGNYSRWRKAR
jgi:hypothetical protein